MSHVTLTAEPSIPTAHPPPASGGVGQAEWFSITLTHAQGHLGHVRNQSAAPSLMTFVTWAQNQWPKAGACVWGEPVRGGLTPTGLVLPGVPGFGARHWGPDWLSVSTNLTVQRLHGVGLLGPSPPARVGPGSVCLGDLWMALWACACPGGGCCLDTGSLHIPEY